MPNLVDLDGTIQPESAARLPVLDRGFLFGDSVYEVLATRRGVPFAAREHLARLRTSAAGIRLELPFQDAELLARVKRVIAAAGFAESYIRIIVTRGTGTAPNIDLAYAPGPAATLILVRELPGKTTSTAHLAIVSRQRNARLALDPAIKSGNYLNNVLGLAEAKDRGATDALFFNAEGFATEATTSNFFAVREGVIHTPPLDAGILAGVTRDLLFPTCAAVGIPLRERNLDEAAVRTADELFLTSTLRDVLPVTKLDGAPVGRSAGRAAGSGAAVGPITARVLQAWQQFAEARLRDVYAPDWASV